MMNAPQMPKGLDAVAIVRDIGVNSFSESSMSKFHASTVRGNRKIKTGINMADSEKLLATELHGVLVGFAGNMAKLLDTARLPEEIALNQKILKTQIADYSDAVDLIIALYKELYSKEERQQFLYDDLDTLKQHVDRRLPLDKRQHYEHVSEWLVDQDLLINITLNAVNTCLGQQSKFFLKGEDAAVENKVEEFYASTMSGNYYFALMMGKPASYQRQPLQWLFYTSYAVKALLDTTVNPSSLRQKIRNNVGTVENIMKHLCDFVQYNETMQQQPVFSLFEKTVAKMQETFVLCHQRTAEQGDVSYYSSRSYHDVKDRLLLDQPGMYDAALARAAKSRRRHHSSEVGI